MALISFCSYAQYPEGFEGTWTTQTGSGAGGPAGWAIVNQTGPGNTWIQGSGSTQQPAHTGAHGAYMNTENVAPGSLASDWLITPATVVPANGQLRFWSHLFVNGDQGTTYKIKVSTVTTAGTVAEQTNTANFTNTVATWTELTINPTQNDWVEKIVSLSAYAGQTVYIAFLMETDAGDRWAIDDVNVVSQCLDPTTLGANNIGLTGATLTWTNPGNATQFEVEILPQAATPTGVGVSVAATTSYVVTGLTVDTCYKYYLRAVCSPGNPSAWVGPFSFCTAALGETCGSAIQVTALPYSTTNDTANFADNVDGSPGATGCGTTSGYLNGNDVFYTYTATANGVISVDVSNHGAYAGVFVYAGCTNVGVSCVGGASNFSATAALTIPTLTVTAGTTYVIVISTWASPQTTPYTLTIQAVNCAPPVGQATTATATSANLSWTNPTSATSWQLVVQSPGAGIPSGAGTTVTANTNYTVSATTPANVAFTSATNYEYYVRSDCGNGTFSAWAGPYPFMTTQVPAELPIAENWETGSTNGWSLSNGTQPNKWAYGTATSNSPTHSIYISNDNGVTNNYNNGSNSYVHAFRDINIPAGTGSVNFAFDWKNLGENNFDFIRVWVVPTSYTPVPGTQITAVNSGGTQVGGNLVGSASWTTVNNVINTGAFAGTTRRFVFEWTNDGSGGIAPPGAIDNINISAITCSAPSALVLGAFTESQATFNWTAPPTPPASYDYYFNTVSTAPTASTVPTGNTTATTRTQTGLTPSTTYYFWVRSHCSDTDQSFWTGPVSFTTPQIPATMPIAENWDAGTTNGWTLSNGTQTNKWFVGTATFNSPGHSLYISNDNGVTHNYTTNAPSVVHAYRDFTVPTGTTDVNLSFDWKNVGENGWDYVRVWLVPSTWTPTAGTQITAGNSGGVQIGGEFVGNATWTTFNSVQSWASYAGTIRRVVFEWRNDTSGGTAPPGAIDNINISVITCPQPINLALGTTAATEATFNWAAPATAPASYDYYLSTSSTAPTASTTPTGNTTATTRTETGLLPSTTYYFWVRSHCSDTDQSFWTGPVSYSTPQIPAVLPVNEDWEAGTTNGWTISNGTQTNKWFLGTATSNSPTHSVYISNDNGVSNAYSNTVASVVHFYRDLAIPAGASDINLSFDWKNLGETGWDYIRVWMVPVSWTPTPGTQVTAAADRIQVGGNFVGNANWSSFSSVQNWANYAGTSRRIIFEWRDDTSGGTNPPGAVDNINISVITCPQPSALTVTGEDTTSISISWTGVAIPGSTYQVYYTTGGSAGPGNAPTTNVIVTTDTFAVIENLTSSTIYDIYVRRICGPGDNSFWTGPVQHETDPLCAEPIDLQVTCLSSTGASFEWDADGTETSWEVVVQPATQPIPTSGTVVTAPVYLAENLTPGTLYSVYVRAICPDVDGFSSWATVNFTTNVGPGDGEPFCAGDNAVPVPNSTGVTGYGSIGCLGSTPNPIWYYLTIDDPGNMNFTLTQVSNAGTPIDVDFAAFGPFTSELDACSQIELVPGANPLIVACSYSASATEIFTIPATQTGQVYALLLTNFNGQAGNITLTQTNIGVPGAGSTSCDITVDLGVDQVLCATDTATITAEVNNPGDDQVYTYTWFAGGEAITPTIVETTEDSQTIEIEGTGTQVISVVVTVPIPVSSDPITDQVTIILSPVFVAPTPAPVALCGNNGSAALDFSTLNLLGTLNPADYEVAGIYTTATNAQAGNSPINTTVPYTTGSTTLYVVIRDINVPSCFQVVPLVITVNTSATAAISYADSPFCSAETTGTVTQTGNAGGTYTSTTGLSINATTGEINVATSTPGTYTVTYTIAASASCPAFSATTQVVIVAAPEATIAYAGTPYCSDAGVATVTFTGSTGGVYSADAGLSINAATGEIDLDASTAGTYTVTYTIPNTGDCAGIAVTTNVTITALPVATISYAGSPYCSDAGVATVTFTGNAGGTYTSDAGLVINAATGEIDLAASASGTYTVTYTIAAAGGCDAVTATAQVTITTLPVAGFDYAYATVCQNAAVQQVQLAAGAVAGVFTTDVAGLTIDAASGAITPATSTVGTYIVTNTIAAAGGCGEVTVAYTITVTEAPVPTFSYAAAAYCQTETTNPLPVIDGVAGTFTAPAGLVINAATGEVNLAASTPGTYTVTNTITGTPDCPTVTSTTTIVITSLPVIEAGQGCVDNVYTVWVNLDNDDVYSIDTVTFEWTKDGAVVGTEASLVVGAMVNGQPALGEGTYQVTVRPNSGAVCPAMAEVTVDKTSCFTPKGISPNGDGKNDTWDLTGFDVRKVAIFNRYGKEVYSFSGVYTDQFAGVASNGENLPSGTYYYMFERNNGQTETGWVYVNFEVN